MALDEARLLWLELDGVRRLAPGPTESIWRFVNPVDVSAVFAWSPTARVLALSDELLGIIGLDNVTQALEKTSFDAADAMPHVVVALNGSTVTDGPIFTFPHDVPAIHIDAGHTDRPVMRPAMCSVICSDAAGVDRARSLARPDNWEPDEWDALVGGNLGSWSMAIAGRDPVSICHTPASNDESAEAGVWTRADHRGRGLALATVRAWWLREREHRSVLFYSTTSDNLASRAVARKLGLVPLGWLWKVSFTHPTVMSVPPAPTS